MVLLEADFDTSTRLLLTHEAKLRGRQQCLAETRPCCQPRIDLGIVSFLANTRFVIAKEGLCVGNFPCGWRPAERESEREIDSARVIDALSIQQALCKRLRLTQHEWIVQQIQSLRSDRGRVAVAGHHTLLGEVEYFERPWGERTQERQIHAPMDALVCVVENHLRPRTAVVQFDDLQFTGGRTSRPRETEVSAGN